MGSIGALAFVIFGWKIREKEYGRAYPVQCSHCNNECYYKPIKIRRWFHIFWIPLIPTKTNFRLECPVCRMGYNLSDEGFSVAKDMAEVTRRNFDGEMTTEEYERYLQQFHSALSPDEDAVSAELDEQPNSDLDDGFKGLSNDHEIDEDRGFE